ncbi:MAG TPA: serine/threonine protein kinase, partial [Sorangium sp.]|nr:serine/threonine protein kinase [Sorangium sp.]
MAEREQFLARLLELPSLQDANVRRAVLRQTLVTLGHGRRGPLALAGVDPRALARSVQVVIGDSLLDDIDFIEPAAAAVAVYQLASALPLGSERRTLGRKVFAYLYNGNAATFAALASRMALGALKPLSGAGIHARVALAMQLPVGEDAAVDRMALAFVGRRELAQSWVNQGAMLGLPQRRLAAQLMERAARAAARRDAAGDAHPLRLFRAVHNPGRLLSPPRPDADVTSSFATAWHALLAEREALVWRHVAIARGLLSTAVDELAHQVRRALDLSLSPTEWRRAATSMVARIAVDRERGLSEALALLDGPITRRDPGLPLAMVWGLGPVAEVEPEAAEELLQELADHSPISIADGLVELRRHVPGIGDKAAARCVAALRQSLATPERDDGLTALASSIIDDLEGRG